MGWQAESGGKPLRSCFERRRGLVADRERGLVADREGVGGRHQM